MTSHPPSGTAPGADEPAGANPWSSPTDPGSTGGEHGTSEGYGAAPAHGESQGYGPAYGQQPAGGPAGSPGGPWSTGADQRPLNTMSLLGLIFAVVFWPAGLVLSIIGLRQTRGGRQRGHGLAVAGTIVSIVLGVIAVVSTIALVASVVGAARSAREAPSVSSAPAEPSLPAAPGDPQPSESAAGAQVLAFGDAADYSGLRVSVAPPQPFTPSDTSAGAVDGQGAVSFDVTLDNASSTAYDPSSLYFTISSGSAEGQQIFDSEQDVMGGPSTPVLPGSTVTFRVAFSAQDPAAITLQVQPDFDAEPAIFTNRSAT